VGAAMHKTGNTRNKIIFCKMGRGQKLKEGRQSLRSVR